MEKKNYWVFVIVFFIFGGLTQGDFATGQDFPVKPINLYIGAGPGGGMSLMGRVLSSKVGEILGVPLVIVNKPGAVGSVAMDYVRRAKPDGYSLINATTGNCVSVPLISKVHYKIDDFEYFGMYATNDMVMAVKSDTPWKTLEDFVDYAKRNPGGLKYASMGYASSIHIAMELLNKYAQIKTVNVPMKSDPEILAALLGGHVHFALGYMQSLKPSRDDGMLRFLAISSDKRSKQVPDVPTFVEKGYPKAVYITWYGVGGPKGMPKEVANKLRDSFEKTFQDKEVQRMLETLGNNAAYMPADEFIKFIHSERKTFRDLYKELGFEVVEAE